jgi:hypothetical protein
MDTRDSPVNRAIAIAATMNHEEERHSWPHLASRTEVRFIMNLANGKGQKGNGKRHCPEDDRKF